MGWVIVWGIDSTSYEGFVPYENAKHKIIVVQMLFYRLLIWPILICDGTVIYINIYDMYIWVV